MPSHSPELQPAERLWSVTNEAIAYGGHPCAIANQTFDSLDELEEVLFQRCKVLSDNRNRIHSLNCAWTLKDNCSHAPVETSSNVRFCPSFMSIRFS